MNQFFVFLFKFKIFYLKIANVFKLNTAKMEFVDKLSIEDYLSKVYS